MVNLSPPINYSCSQVRLFSLCLFLVSKVSRILFVVEIYIVVQKFITYVSNLANTFVIHDHWMTNDAYRLFRLRLIFGLIGTSIKFLWNEHSCEEKIEKIGKAIKGKFLMVTKVCSIFTLQGCLFWPCLTYQFNLQVNLVVHTYLCC